MHRHDLGKGRIVTCNLNIRGLPFFFDATSGYRLKAMPRLFEVGDNSTALYHVAVILDPLSEIAQRWSSLLEVRDSGLVCIYVWVEADWAGVSGC